MILATALVTLYLLIGFGALAEELDQQKKLGHVNGVSLVYGLIVFFAWPAVVGVALVKAANRP